MLASTAQIVDLPPPTPEQLDLLSTVMMISFALAVLAFVCVVGAAPWGAVKTRLPRRSTVLPSILLLPLWFVFEQSMGGYLEMTFGPVALLVAAIVYCGFAIVFSIGFVRMSSAFLKHAAAPRRDG